MVKLKHTVSDRHSREDFDSTQKAYRRNLYIMVICALLIVISMLAGKQCQTLTPEAEQSEIELKIESELSAFLQHYSIDSSLYENGDETRLNITIISSKLPKALKDQIAEIERIIYDVLSDKEVEIVIRFYESTGNSANRKGIAFVTLHKTSISNIRERISR